MKTPAAQWRSLHQRLTACLRGPGWISAGSVQDRGPGAGGPCYHWTRKVRGKTVSVALSHAQYLWLRAAIANWRTVQAILQDMQRLSRSVLFTTLPHTKRRKNPTKKTLGLI